MQPTGVISWQLSLLHGTMSMDIFIIWFTESSNTCPFNGKRVRQAFWYMPTSSTLSSTLSSSSSPIFFISPHPLSQATWSCMTSSIHQPSPAHGQTNHLCHQSKKARLGRLRAREGVFCYYRTDFWPYAQIWKSQTFCDISQLEQRVMVNPSSSQLPPFAKKRLWVSLLTFVYNFTI